MKKNVFVFVLLTALAVSVYGQTAADFIKSGNDAYNKKDYKKAIADFTEAIRLNPNSAEAYQMRGQATAHENNFYPDKATIERIIADFTEVIRLNPNSTAGYFSRAQIYEWEAMKDTDKAIADYTQCIRLDPNYIDAYRRRAGTYFGKGDYKQAREDVNKVLQISPNNQQAKDLDAKLKEKGY
jgi:tetratricopeptide (TPR) repeat protein